MANLVGSDSTLGKLQILHCCCLQIARRELDEVEANLRYWRRQEQSGGHFWNALLRRVGSYIF